MGRGKYLGNERMEEAGSVCPTGVQVFTSMALATQDGISADSHMVPGQIMQVWELTEDRGSYFTAPLLLVARLPEGHGWLAGCLVHLSGPLLSHSPFQHIE